jgi:hypothetical protein
MHAKALAITGSKPQVRVMLVGDPQAPVDCELVVLLAWSSVFSGSRTITSAQAGLLASGAAGKTTVGAQPDNSSARAMGAIFKNFIINRLPLSCE